MFRTSLEPFRGRWRSSETRDSVSDGTNGRLSNLTNGPEEVEPPRVYNNKWSIYVTLTVFNGGKISKRRVKEYESLSLLNFMTSKLVSF